MSVCGMEVMNDLMGKRGRKGCVMGTIAFAHELYRTRFRQSRCATDKLNKQAKQTQRINPKTPQQGANLML